MQTARKAINEKLTPLIVKHEEVVWIGLVRLFLATEIIRNNRKREKS